MANQRNKRPAYGHYKQREAIKSIIKEKSHKLPKSTISTEEREAYCQKCLDGVLERYKDNDDQLSSIVSASFKPIMEEGELTAYKMYKDILDTYAILAKDGTFKDLGYYNLMKTKKKGVQYILINCMETVCYMMECIHPSFQKKVIGKVFHVLRDYRSSISPSKLK